MMSMSVLLMSFDMLSRGTASSVDDLGEDVARAGSGGVVAILTCL